MIRLSCDDGCASDVRVAELCKKYKIDCTFYWPVEWHSLAYDKGYEPLTFDNAITISENFEVGSHTVTHRHLTDLPKEEAEAEILESLWMLQDLFPNQEISKFAPPRGYTNKELTEFTLKWYESQRLTKGLGLVHIHPNSGANGNLDWKDYYRMVKERGEAEVMELWCHSWELDKFEIWSELEQFLKIETHKKDSVVA